MTDKPDNPPISWLELERYALGELPEHRMAHVHRALATGQSDTDTIAVFERISSDARSLPPLKESSQHLVDDLSRTRDTPGRGLSEFARRAVRKIAGHRRVWVGAGLSTAIAAALVLVFATADSKNSTGRPSLALGFPGPRVRIKGGDVAIGLVRERAGVIAHDPDVFADGDRFKVVVTCPPDGPLYGDVVVYQDGQPAVFPLEREGAASALVCGNRVALPGAFRLTGDRPARICLAFAPDAPPDRSALSRPGHLEAPTRAVCTRLDAIRRW